MCINTIAGTVDLSGAGIVGPWTSHDAFRATETGAASTPIVLHGSWRSYDFHLDIGGTPFDVAIYFHGERLFMLELSNVSAEFGTSWADWSPENEERRRHWHDRWLAGHGVRQGEYAWGTVSSMTDPKSGGSSIVLRYRDAGS